MGRSIDGILLVDKEEGKTSYGVVRKVRAAFSKSDVKKVGHAGTLDPFATGLLIILLGQGTKLSSFLMSERKVYLATIRLGIETDTMDPTGQVVSTSPIPALSIEQIQEKANCLVGHREQVPPIYSAVKYKGTRAYKLARKGIKFDLKSKKIIVHSFSVLSVDLPHITVEVTCSGGTYVRSLASELGRDLGPGAHLKSLRRLGSGSFEVKNALSSKEIFPDDGWCALRERVMPLTKALPGMTEIKVNKDLAEKIRHGYQPVREELKAASDFSDHNGIGDGHFKLVRGGDLLAIIKIEKGKGTSPSISKLERVFL